MNQATKSNFFAALASAGVTLLIGILFTAKPDILSIICHYAGIVLCAAAAVMIVIYFVKRRPSGGFLVYGILAAVAGILLLILPGMLRFLIPVFFGLWILMSSGSGMYRNFCFRHEHKFWWIGFLLCTVGAVLGVYILTRPTNAMDATVRIIGIVLIVLAVLRSVSILMARRHFAKPSTGDVIDITPNKE